MSIIRNLATHLLSQITGANINSQDVGQGVSDTLFGTTYGQQNLAAQQFGYNQQLANEERSWQERMLAEDRAYNSPANQMALMREAGLNPSLAYGQMSDMSGSAPNAGAASVGLGSAQHGTLGGFDVLSISQAELMRSQARKNDAEANRIDELLEGEKGIQNATIDNIISNTGLNNKSVENFEHTWKLMDAEERKISSEILKNTFEIELQSQKWKEEKKLIKQRIRLLAQDYRFKQQQTRHEKALADLTEEQLDVYVQTKTAQIVTGQLEPLDLLSEIGVNMQEYENLKKSGILLDDDISRGAGGRKVRAWEERRRHSSNPLVRIDQFVGDMFSEYTGRLKANMPKLGIPLVIKKK